MPKLLSKFNDWYFAADPATKLSFNLLCTCFTYFLINAINPLLIKMIVDFLVTSLMMMALGVFSLHVIAGPNRLMLPVYKVLYRLTGNPFYLNPLSHTPTQEQEHTDVNK